MNENQSESFYDQFAGNEAPQPKQREVNWQANREDNTKPYVNEQPQHVKEAMRIDQPNRSYYEFQRLAFNNAPLDSFGAMVNEAFGRLPAGFNFIEQRDLYMSFYKQKLNELD